MAIYAVFRLIHFYVLPVLRTGVRHYVFAFESSSPFMAKTTTILEILIFMDITWISVLATSFLVNVLSVVLRREFDKCIENLQEKINVTGTLCSDTFSGTVERF